MTSLKLFNTLSRQKEIFKPLKNGKVGFYSCGPTVYWNAHIGNLRSYINADVLRRVLKYNGYQVKQVMNITDIEDKIIKKANQEHKKISEITRYYEKLFFEDIKKLNIEKAEFYPRATRHIKEMISLIQKLLKKRIAYQGQDKSIYFNISKFKNYGRLSSLKKRELKTGVRIEADEYNKNEAQDFVLWKHAKENEPSWPTSFGDGRPGWHIECSTMAIKYLGESFDIHSGGIDLIFPHHENEIAQSEAATGKKFVKYWIHNEHILVDNQKMAKSLGNFYTIEDVENKKINPLAYRYLVLNSHYRSKLNFTWESLWAAQNALDNLYEKIIQINTDSNEKEAKDSKLVNDYKKKFLETINDDLNTPKTLAILWKMVKDDKIPKQTKKQLISDFDKIFGLNLNKVKAPKIPQKIQEMANERWKLRANQQFIQADALRKKIEALGYIIEDTSEGYKISKIKSQK